MQTLATSQFATNQTAENPRSGKRCLAYLLSIYPAVSHTFFLNEICQLRELGFAIDVASINTPALSPEGPTALEAREREKTFYIKSAKRTHVLSVLTKTLLTRPSVIARGLRAALSLDPWNLRASVYSIFYLVEALLLGDWMRRHGHDHLHVHFGGPVANVAMLMTAAWGIPYSIMIHGPEEFYDVEKNHLRNKVQRAKFVLCISDYCRSQLMKIADTDQWNKMRVVRLGVDPGIFAPADKPTSPVVEILCVGRLVAAKGQLVLLRAITELISRGHQLRLRLVGDGPERPRLEAFIAEHGLNSAVVLEGARSHEATRSFLAAADIFVLASFAEGLPVALMEAMAMGIPCVSTYVAGIPELIRDGLDGLLVPPSSYEALTSALERLIIDGNLRRSLGASGRLRVLELYQLERNVRVLAATLDQELA